METIEKNDNTIVYSASLIVVALIDINTFEITKDVEIPLELTSDQYTNLRVQCTRRYWDPSAEPDWASIEYLVYNPKGKTFEEKYYINYKAEAKFLYQALIDGHKSKINIYIHIFKLIDALRDSGSAGVLDKEYGETKQLKDVYFSGLDFKVKIYFAIKTGISFKFLTKTHAIKLDPIGSGEEFYDSNKELMKFLRIIDKVNKESKVKYVKYLKSL